MPNFQQLILVGHVGRDPELRYLPSGIAVCDFSMAVTDHWTDKTTNEKQERTTWFTISCWRGLAETMNQLIRKGQAVMVIGTVEGRAYTAQDGTPRASLDVTAKNVVLLGKRDGAEQVEGGEQLPF